MSNNVKHNIKVSKNIETLSKKNSISQPNSSNKIHPQVIKNAGKLVSILKDTTHQDAFKRDAIREGIKDSKINELWDFLVNSEFVKHKRKSEAGTSYDEYDFDILKLQKFANLIPSEPTNSEPPEKKTLLDYHTKTINICTEKPDLKDLANQIEQNRVV